MHDQLAGTASTGFSNRHIRYWCTRFAFPAAEIADHVREWTQKNHDF
jgi:hypothetical protein